MVIFSNYEEHDEFLWDAMERKLRNYFLNKANSYLLIGTVGTWQGSYKCGTIFQTFDEFFYKATEGCHYWKFEEVAGLIQLTCSHHDGNNIYNIRSLTDEGEDIFSDWENDELTEELNKYSLKDIHGYLWDNYTIDTNFYK